jgi:hypothetical protein
MRNGLDCVPDYKTPNRTFLLLSIANRLKPSGFSQDSLHPEEIVPGLNRLEAAVVGVNLPRAVPS